MGSEFSVVGVAYDGAGPSARAVCSSSSARLSFLFSLSPRPLSCWLPRAPRPNRVCMHSCPGLYLGLAVEWNVDTTLDGGAPGAEVDLCPAPRDTRLWNHGWLRKRGSYETVGRLGSALVPPPQISYPRDGECRGSQRAPVEPSSYQCVRIRYAHCLSPRPLSRCSCTGRVGQEQGGPCAVHRRPCPAIPPAPLDGCAALWRSRCVCPNGNGGRRPCRGRGGFRATRYLILNVEGSGCPGGTSAHRISFSPAAGERMRSTGRRWFPPACMWGVSRANVQPPLPLCVNFSVPTHRGAAAP